MNPHETNARSDLADGRARFEHRAWEDAFQSFARADQAAPLEPDDLELLAWSAALTGRDPELLEMIHGVGRDAARIADAVLAGRLESCRFPVEKRRTMGHSEP